MAFSLSEILQDQARQKASEDIARQTKAQQEQQGKRKKWSGLIGGALGTLGGIAAVGALGLTGGLAAPLVMGAVSSLSKKWVDEGSKKGLLGKGLKGADVSKIKGGKYGYGKKQAKEYRTALGESRKTDWGADTLLGDIAGSYITAGMSGGLTSGVKDVFKGDIAKGLTGQADWASSMASGDIGGWTGAKESLLGSLPGGKSEPDPEPYVFGSDEWDESMWGEEYPLHGPGFQQGGQVPSQNELLGLAILSQMQNQQKAYDDTPLEQAQPTISDYFASEGKTLGGSNTKSLSQLLGR